MKLKDKKVGFVLTGSFCTFEKTKEEIKKIVKEGADVLPIMSEHAYELDTKFGEAKYHIKIIHKIQDAEPIGPKKLTDILIVAPCSRKYDCKTCKFNNR